MSHKYEVGQKVVINGNVAEASGGFYYKTKYKGSIATIKDQLMDDEDPCYLVDVENAGDHQVLEEDVIVHNEPKKVLTKVTLQVTIETDDTDQASAVIAQAVQRAVESKNCKIKSPEVNVSSVEEIESFTEQEESDECDEDCDNCSCGC